MSACISSHGEYSEHTVTSTPFTCDWCGVFEQDAAVAEIRRLKADVPLTLDRAGPSDKGGFGITFGAGTVAAQDVLIMIADAMRTWFADNDGINYVEAILRDSDRREWVMTVTPHDKPSAHTLRQRAEGERDDLEARLIEVRQRVAIAESRAEQAESQVERVRAAIAHLDVARAEGFVYTYGQIQRALGVALTVDGKGG